ncbi:uncharacterized protein [Apostichopus japonicus]|uniref:uncharacterized protein n=1 Tax=Stichopus japonicus TaxID=307972 RepID=UPI003AB4C364
MLNDRDYRSQLLFSSLNQFGYQHTLRIIHDDFLAITLFIKPGCKFIRLIARVDEIHVIISEVDPDEVKKFFQPEAFSKVVVHDYWTNHLGWNVSGDDTLRVNSDEDLFSGVWSTPRASSSSKIAVVVDAISSFLSYQTYSVISISTWSLLHATIGIPEIQSVCVLGLIHADIHTEKTLNALRHLFSVMHNRLNATWKWTQF